MSFRPLLAASFLMNVLLPSGCNPMMSLPSKMVTAIPLRKEAFIAFWPASGNCPLFASLRMASSGVRAEWAVLAVFFCFRGYPAFGTLYWLFHSSVNVRISERYPGKPYRSLASSRSNLKSAGIDTGLARRKSVSRLRSGRTGAGSWPASCMINCRTSACTCSGRAL